MERKIGEIFECSGVKLRVEPEICVCKGCYFKCDSFKLCTQYKSVIGECQKSSRSDIGIIFKKVEDMETRTIKLTLEKAKEFYKKGGEFRDLALSAFTEKELKEIYLPKTWGEFCALKDIQPGEAYFCQTDGDFRVCEKHNCKRGMHSAMMLPSLKDAEAHLALAQLHQLRDYYRQGWEPDWSDGENKYCIVYSGRCSDTNSNYFITAYTCNRTFLSFQTKEIAKLFLENFRGLIEAAGDLV